MGNSLLAKLVLEANFILLPKRGKLSETSESYLEKRLKIFGEASINI